MNVENHSTILPIYVSMLRDTWTLKNSIVIYVRDNFHPKVKLDARNSRQDILNFELQFFFSCTWITYTKSSWDSTSPVPHMRIWIHERKFIKKTYTKHSREDKTIRMWCMFYEISCFGGEFSLFSLTFFHFNFDLFFQHLKRHTRSHTGDR